MTSTIAENIDYKPSELMKQEKVWLRFEGTKARPDGSKPKYRCERLTEKYVDEVLKYILDFYKEEMVNRSMNTSTILVESTDMAKKYWKLKMNEGYSVVCVTDDQDERKLVGFNLNFKQKWPVDQKWVQYIQHEPIKAQLKALADLKNSYNIVEKFGTSEHMDATGLYVLPEYRGQGIAVNILLARVPICKSAGIKLSANTFSSNAVRRSAEKAGFQVFSEITTEEYQKRYGIVMDNVENERVTFMGKLID